MTIDLSTLKIGDRIKYRDGTISVILNVQVRPSELHKYPICVETEKNGIDLYTNEGLYSAKLGISEWDIVEIIPQTNLFFEETLQGLNEALNHTKTYNPATAKTDTGKDRLDLLPYAGLASAAKAFEYGLKQYGHNNYQNAKSYRPFLAAAARHLAKKLDGEDLDSDSGLDHISHSLACLLMAEKLKFLGKPMTDLETHKPYGVRNKPKE